MNATRQPRRPSLAQGNAPSPRPPVLFAPRTAWPLRRRAGQRATEPLGAEGEEAPDLAQLEFVIQEAGKATDGQWDAWC
jgi:hypothetical protein